MFANIPQINPDLAAKVLGDFVDPGQDPKILLVVFVAVLARILGFMIVAPFFGGMNIPMTARVGFAVIMAAVTVPYALPTVAPAIALELKGGGAFDLLLLAVNQVLVGLMLGFCASFIFYAIESAGRIIDTQRGSNITDIIAPQSGERTSPLGQWLMMVALMVLLVSGLHMAMIEGLLNSFKVFPPTLGLEWLGDPLRDGSNPAAEGVLRTFAEMSGSSLLLTLQIAAPAMITLLLTDVLLGIINRGAPQVNVFALSQVVKGPIGIFAIMIALLPTWNYVRDHALPRMVNGNSSITAVAEQMNCANVEATRVKRGNDRAEDDQCRTRGQLDADGDDELLSTIDATEEVKRSGR